ncbi:hypothetical protein BGX28_002011 [Mortierella sp. GBA30]|nr:hypothetical protein BGX28_002011 [Mortierella sp. GBA30]
MKEASTIAETSNVRFNPLGDSTSKFANATPDSELDEYDANDIPAKLDHHHFLNIILKYGIGARSWECLNPPTNQQLDERDFNETFKPKMMKRGYKGLFTKRNDWNPHGIALFYREKTAKVLYLKVVDASKNKFVTFKSAGIVGVFEFNNVLAGDMNAVAGSQICDFLMLGELDLFLDPDQDISRRERSSTYKRPDDYIDQVRRLKKASGLTKGKKRRRSTSDDINDSDQTGARQSNDTESSSNRSMISNVTSSISEHSPGLTHETVADKLRQYIRDLKEIDDLGKMDGIEDLAKYQESSKDTRINEDAVVRHMFHISSVYDEQNTVDFILYGQLLSYPSRIEPAARLSIPRLLKEHKQGLPAAYFGSDHLSMATELMLL